MASLNRAQLIGHLGNDPETKYTQGGSAVTNISVATSERWTDKQTGEQQERTEWHRVVFFGKLAEIAGEYLRKGAQVFIEGRIQTDKWTDQEGVERYTTKIIADELKMLGKREANDNAPRQQGQSRQAAGGSRPPMRQESAPRREAPPARSTADDFADDDIPF